MPFANDSPTAGATMRPVPRGLSGLPCDADSVTGGDNPASGWSAAFEAVLNPFPEGMLIKSRPAVQ